MKNKLLAMMIVLISAIMLIGATAFVVIMKYTNDGEQKEPSIDEVLKLTVELPEITTKLLSNNFIQISFNIETDSKKAKEELEKREFQVRNIIIKELSDMKSEQFKGEDGIVSLENKLKERINTLMQEGNVVNVYTTSFLPQ